MKYPLSLALFFMVTFSYSQDHPTCDGARYIDDVFVELDSILDVQFGEGVTIAGNNQELLFDVFMPANDVAEARPVIVFAYGGSFIGGNKETMHWICKRYARKGFVTVSIDYRLYDLPLFPVPTEQEMKVVVTKSVADMKGAIRFLRADVDGDNLFKIDPNFVFVSGISAGGITACHTAFLDEDDTFTPDLIEIFEDEGGLEGTTNDLDYPSDVQGIVNFSGGLNDGNWIDANDPPLLSVHEDGDGTVPYDGGFASIFGIDIIYMEGSGALQTVADSVGILNYLRTIDADSHVGYFTNDDLTDELIDWSSTFLHDIICEEQVLSDETIQDDLNSLVVFPNPSNGYLNFKHNLEGRYSIAISDLNGRILLSNRLENTLDIAHLEEGIYFLEISSLDQNARIIKKIVLE